MPPIRSAGKKSDNIFLKTLKKKRYLCNHKDYGEGVFASSSEAEVPVDGEGVGLCNELNQKDLIYGTMAKDTDSAR